MRNLNICRERRSKSFLFLLLLLGGLLLACPSKEIFALDPNRAISQYTRDFWGIEKGFSGGTVYAIAQTPDGYLWIGSEKGLIRFDGLKFELIQPVNTPLFPAEPVLGLITDAEGSLWIRLRSPKIVRYRNGIFEDALSKLGEFDPRITTMSRGRDGNLLFSTLQNGPLAYEENEIKVLVPKTELPNSFIISFSETSDGEIWMGTREAGLYRYADQKNSAVTKNLPDRKINFLLPDENNLWIGTDRGIAFWNGTRLVTPDFPETIQTGQIFTLLKDRQSNLWIGTRSNGLARLNQTGKIETEKSADKSEKIITALFEDREGNLWVGSQQGIERLRDNIFLTYSISEGLPADKNGALYVDSTLKTWFAPLTGGLFWLKGNSAGNLTNDKLDNDVIYSITGGKNDLWIGRQRGGLTHLRFESGAAAMPNHRTYTTADGLAQNSVYTVFQSSDDAIWAGTLSGGASHLKDGKFTTYTTADGLAANAVNAIAETADGTIWFATSGGLSSLSKNAWRSYTTKEGLPINTVNCLLAQTSSGGLWLGTAKGLGYFSDNRIRFFSDAPGLPSEAIFGLAEDKNGFLWVSTINRVLRVETAKLLSGALSDANVREFALGDGLHGLEGVKRSRSLVADETGRIWLSSNRGISMADPQSIKENISPALVQINQITIDGMPLDFQDRITIEAGRQRITINFIGLSLAAPEKVKYRYKLENFDQEWSEPTAIREAVYTNLSPGSYRFKVIASNSQGIWNSQEAVVELEIAPFVWQTRWFRLFCFIAAVLLGLMLFRVRLYRITDKLNLRFEERLAERTRIAQELHDSLLQGVVGASMQLDVAIDRLPENISEKQSLSKVLHNMKRVIEEGRNTVRGLRAADSHSPDGSLEQSFSKFWQDLSADEKIDFRLVVDGSPRALHPLVRDEVYRIGGEALINAVRHSGGSQIEFEINYAAKHLKILIRDDGCGIDSNILNAGREGHWGLTGMRERAENIGAKLKVWSRHESGTEIELIVPNHIAFESKSSDNYLLKRLSKFYPRQPKTRRLEGKNEH